MALQSPDTGYAGFYGPNAIITPNGQAVGGYAPTIVETPDGTTSGATPSFYSDWTRTSTVAAPTTDANGNLSFWTDPGMYLMTFTLPGGSPTTLLITVDPWYPDSAWNVPTTDTAGTVSPVSGDVRLADASTGSVTETLPTPQRGLRMRVIKIDTSANPVFITVTGGSTIIGQDLGSGYPQQAEVAIFGYGTCYEFISGASNWYLITPRQVGRMQEWPGTTAPAGAFLTHGQAISRTTYADLFGVIGTTYGVGDGSTTFNLPDTRSVSIIGAGTGTHTGTTARTAGDYYGGETHTLLESDIPSHHHTIGTDSGATEFYVKPTSGSEAAYINSSNYGQPGTLLVSYGSDTDNAYGQTTDIPTVTPTLAVDFIIWAQ